ncbi:TrmH family RNA methyltransferase [Methanofollis sp. W23]|uniref:RNA methyltransferase n=1 Tax=Methanofollis sp. W23 TaxID=2817849 RepID=UPI001AEAEC98|nr:RNA methyltransferase [Methanofollis sp. W23]MBP2144787.1 TrmH family RNA methyltransferase [Methanofollis sp. W23]
MPEVEIVLVQPLYEGNIGFAARVMKNFGFTRLVLVDPCEIGDDAIARSSHARDVLEHAERKSLEEVFAESDLVVATTGELSKSVCTSMRMPYYAPNELREILSDVDGRVSILFGRENWGLNNEEVSRCDLICTIPTSEIYPIMNLSHAVGIVCYELAHLPRGTYRVAGKTEREALIDHFGTFLARIDHPDFKRQNTLLMLRRIFGRTALTTREVSTLHGILRRAEWHIDHDMPRQGTP